MARRFVAETILYLIFASLLGIRCVYYSHTLTSKLKRRSLLE